MPRIARVIAPGYPHHVTQRGNNRATVFFDEEDRQTYLDILNRYSRKHDLQIWAYCLMDNHLHLLAVPETEASLSRGIGLTNQVYTQYLNRKLSQSGRIWQNRFFSCVVENETYLWAAARYIERCRGSSRKRGQIYFCGLTKLPKTTRKKEQIYFCCPITVGMLDTRMPRTARILIPNYPHHIIQRGHNRQTVFAADADYQYYLENLAEWKEALDCQVYAFCLMTNHIHLVINPGEDPENLGRLMKRVAGRQTRFVNRLEGRSGTLWEGRFKSSPIDSDRYLLACCRYVEMNPVVAGLCGDPCDYPWSSCRSKLSEKEYRWLDYDPFYLGLGSCEKERQRNYLDFLAGSVSDREQDIIQKAIQRGQLTGEGAFVDEVEAKLNRRIELRGPGRPQGQKK